MIGLWNWIVEWYKQRCWIAWGILLLAAILVACVIWGCHVPPIALEV